jgi:oxygen-independent coproporphyrinogen-3 oxidase
MNSKELALYIHIPFCIKKCDYCDFISFPIENNHVIFDYIENLKSEIRMYSTKLRKHYELTSIYIGGGTPTAINENYIDIIIKTVKDGFNIKENAEITIEANPGTVTRNKVEKYKKMGVNRVSLGVQTLNDELLKTLGRIHKSKDYFISHQILRKAGITNISVDLMFGLPGQTMESWEKTLHEVLKSGIEHISAYGLIIEKNTPFYQKWLDGLIDIDDLMERRMYHYLIEALRKNGFDHYEISSFSKPGYKSMHNLVYWDEKEYIGVGLNAHSFFMKKRWGNVCVLNQYNKLIKEGQPPRDELTIEYLSEKTIKKEFMMLGFRKIEGINLKEYFQRFNTECKIDFKKELLLLMEKELIHENNNCICLKRKGLDFANQVFREFV